MLFALFVIEVVVIAPLKVNISQTEASSKVGTGQTQEAEQTMSGVHLVEANDGGKEWELWSETAYGYKENGKWLLKAVKVKFFGKDGTTYMVTGEEGTVVVQKKDIEIRGQVEMRSSNGYVFKTPRVEYDSESKTLEGPEEVYMRGPKDTENGLLELKGRNLLADLKSNIIKVRENVRANRTVGAADHMQIRSGQATFSGTTASADFRNDVVVDLGVTRITGPHAEFGYDKEAQHLSSLTVDGGARISDLNRWATADRIFMTFKKDEVTLNGSPLVVQNGNELRGEQIILSNKGRQIRVQGAKAKLETPDDLKGDRN